MRKISFSLTIILAISLIFNVGCSTQRGVNSDTADKGKVSVYTSFYAMYDFTKKIGGDKINVTNLVPAGTEPHDWEPSPRDLANLEKADMLVYNGAGMEGWINKVLTSIKNDKLIIVEASKGISLLVNKNADPEQKFDPHIWLNPVLAKKQMELIRDALVKVDPVNKEFYEKNYAENSSKLDALDSEYKNMILKSQRKEIVVSHEAFSYLCNAYGIRQIAIEGLNAEAEPTPAKMAEIAKFAKDNQVKVIFSEELISPKVAESLAKSVGAKNMVLNPLEGLKDEDIKAGKEYISVMKENLQALKEALN